MTNDTYSLEGIRKYLLGQLPAPETERLDELSIADEECAELIRAVECDLFDAYVRGELHGSELDQWRSRYATTERGRESVRFAEALQSLATRPASSVLDGEYPEAKGSWTRSLLVAALVVLTSATVWQAFSNRTLRAQLASAASARDVLDRERERLDAAARQPAAAAQPSPPHQTPPRSSCSHRSCEA